MLPSHINATVPELPSELRFLTGLRKTQKGTDFCGGSLINPTIVVTAAHCVEQFVNSDGDTRGEVIHFWASIGSLSAEGAVYGEQIPVMSVKLHPEYNNVTRANNVAVLKLAFPSLEMPMRLFNSQPVPSAGRSFGFKQLTDDGARLYEVLDFVDVAVVNSNDQCAERLGETVDSTNFCALN